jgi:hypothetical protein
MHTNAYILQLQQIKNKRRGPADEFEELYGVLKDIVDALAKNEAEEERLRLARER